MFKAIILPLAKEDIRSAAIWYNDKQKGLGKRFMEEVHSKVLYIRKDSKSSTVRYDKIRCVTLDVFPFMIHYSIDDKQKTVIITAVFHTSLNPERWRNR